MRVIRRLVVGLVFVQPCVSQDYPYWFLFEGEVGCGTTAVGIAQPSFSRDSAVALSFRQGCGAFVQRSWVKISGGQGFWATEGGTYWMGADFTEEYDTAGTRAICSGLSGVDTIVTKDGVFVLVARTGCTVDGMKGKTSSIVGKAPPDWVERLPSEKGYSFAIGLAPTYFYETSSWAEAERAARRNLARGFHTELRSMQKLTSTEGQEVRQEELSVTLKNWRVVARWRDVNDGVFYVLIKAPVR